MCAPKDSFNSSGGLLRSFDTIAIERTARCASEEAHRVISHPAAVAVAHCLQLKLHHVQK
jgi:hypothetical protein